MKQLFILLLLSTPALHTSDAAPLSPPTARLKSARVELVSLLKAFNRDTGPAISAALQKYDPKMAALSEMLESWHSSASHEERANIEHLIRQIKRVRTHIDIKKACPYEEESRQLLFPHELETKKEKLWERLAFTDPVEPYTDKETSPASSTVSPAPAAAAASVVTDAVVNADHKEQAVPELGAREATLISRTPAASASSSAGDVLEAPASMAVESASGPSASTHASTRRQLFTAFPREFEEALWRSDT